MRIKYHFQKYTPNTQPVCGAQRFVSPDLKDVYVGKSVNWEGWALQVTASTVLGQRHSVFGELMMGIMPWL